jgi:hypothetical protein
MRTAVYPINNPKRVLPTNTQQPRKDKGTTYAFDRKGTRTIVV